jgi:hypothetical protein
MTVDNETYEAITKASEHWIDAYCTGGNVDIDSFENYSNQFLEQVTKPDITAAELIGSLCVNTFSGVAFSSIAKFRIDEGSTDFEEVPVVSMVLHPFKASKSLTFGEKEPLFGVVVDDTDPKKNVAPVEFVKPIAIFKPWPKETQTGTGRGQTVQTNDHPPQGNTADGEPTVLDANHPGLGIPTPSFKDFFDDHFLSGKGDYQPLNNATEIAPAEVSVGGQEQEDERNGSWPEAIYTPRKVIPLTPTMVRIIFEHKEHDFSGIINSIREHAWYKLMDSFKKKESRDAYLKNVYRILQAFWAHGQPETESSSSMAKFVHSDPTKLLKPASYRTAVDKTFYLTEVLALSVGNLKDTDSHSRDENTGSKRNGGGTQDELAPLNNKTAVRLATVMEDLSASVANQASSKEATMQENSWAFKAVKLASSMNKEEAATELFVDLQEIVKLGEKHARDFISHNLNHHRKANFRIDKTMASNIRTCQVFRPSKDLAGNMSVFHCLPRSNSELRNFISGDEFDIRLRAKAISGKAVQGLFETKLGIATNGYEFTRQMKNFWIYNCFMFGDNSWLANMVKEIYKVVKGKEEEIIEASEMHRDYLISLAGKINNDYHDFLTSCIDADGDIRKVDWEVLETTSKEISRMIRSQAKPSLMINGILRTIADEARSELKRKQEAAAAMEEHTGFTPPRKGQKKEQVQQLLQKNPANKQPPQRFKNEQDADSDREDGIQRKNPNVNKDWKMSSREFKNVLAPYTADMPKLGNRSICAMFHIVGRCLFGNRCRHSHDELPESVCVEIERWIADCKEQNKKENKNRNGNKK